MRICIVSVENERIWEDKKEHENYGFEWLSTLH